MRFAFLTMRFAFLAFYGFLRFAFFIPGVFLPFTFCVFTFCVFGNRRVFAFCVFGAGLFFTVYVLRFCVLRFWCRTAYILHYLKNFFAVLLLVTWCHKIKLFYLCITNKLQKHNACRVFTFAFCVLCRKCVFTKCVFAKCVFATVQLFTFCVLRFL